MPRILVIADDLSGAAEIAGIGWRYGLPTRLYRDRAQCDEGLTVIDTDTRSLSPADARRGVKAYLSAVSGVKFDLLYKKTDSALRGQIIAEVGALMETFPNAYGEAMLLPQNPSRGRIIVDGKYLIDGVPLHQSSFAHDPEYPAKTSDVTQLLGGVCAVARKDDKQVPASKILIVEASNLEDVRFWAKRGRTGVSLPVGGADFFSAILEARGFEALPKPSPALTGQSRLFVCGSASAYRHELMARADRERMVTCPMPEDAFRSGNVLRWAQIVSGALRENPRALVVIDQPVDRTPRAAERLQSSLANLVARVLSAQPIDELFLEGGATASAVCRWMHWDQFSVRGEIAPGVVQLHVRDKTAPTIFIKPGSYPWPEIVWKPPI